MPTKRNSRKKTTFQQFFNVKSKYTTQRKKDTNLQLNKKNRGKYLQKREETEKKSWIERQKEVNYRKSRIKMSSMLDKIRERSAEVGRRLSVGVVGTSPNAPRRVSTGNLSPTTGRENQQPQPQHMSPLDLSPGSARKRTSLDCSPGDVSSHLYTAMVGLFAHPAQHMLKV